MYRAWVNEIKRPKICLHKGKAALIPYMSESWCKTG
jgi:hypothetical protein